MFQPTCHIYFRRTRKLILHLGKIVLPVAVQIFAEEPLQWTRQILPKHKIKYCLLALETCCSNLSCRSEEQGRRNSKIMTEFLAVVIQPWLQHGEQLNAPFTLLLSHRVFETSKNVSKTSTSKMY